MKKAISLFLALMLCVGILAVPAFAEYLPVSSPKGSVYFEDATVIGTVKYGGEDLTLYAFEAGPKLRVEDVYHVSLTSYFANVANGSAEVGEVEVVIDGYSWLNFYFDPEDEGTYRYCELDIDGSMVKFFAYCVSDLAAVSSKPVVMVSPQKVTLDGKSVEPEHYNIDGDNYFKLRDLASLLNGTAAQFEVGYNDATKTISVTTGKAYTPNGDEMLVGVDQSASAVVSTQKIEINGTAQSLTAYNIGGNNFFRLRDLNELLGYGVDYDAATNTAIITSK